MEDAADGAFKDGIDEQKLWPNMQYNYQGRAMGMDLFDAVPDSHHDQGRVSVCLLTLDHDVRPY